MTEDLELLLAERAIQRVLTSYSRGVDRYDFELVRSCYWPDWHRSITDRSSAGSMTSSRSWRSR